MTKIEPTYTPLGLDSKTLNDLFVRYDDRQLLWLSGYLYGLSVAKNAPTNLTDLQTVPNAVSNGSTEKLPIMSSPIGTTIITMPATGRSYYNRIAGFVSSRLFI